MRYHVIIYVVLSILLTTGILIYDQKIARAQTSDINFSTTVQSSLSLNIAAGDTVAFGAITAGAPITAPDTGTIASVTTSAANGYTLGVSDGATGGDSALLHSDTITRITDVTSGNITTPALWGSHTGLGITLFAADTNKESKWGSGTTYDDTNNKYAAIPQTATTTHTVTGAVVGANTSSWAFKLDVPADQKAGDYSGTMTFTATAVLI